MTTEAVLRASRLAAHRMQAPLGWDRHWNRYWLLSGPRASAPRNRAPLVCVELRPEPGKVRGSFFIVTVGLCRE
jgi:hypothetical protein